MECFFLRNSSFILKNLRCRIIFNLWRNAHQLDLVKAERLAVHSKEKLSTLYVPGRRGSDVYQIVKPLIDVEFIAANIEAIKLSCQLRGLTTQLDLEQLVSKLRLWKILKNDYKNILEREHEYQAELKSLQSLGQDCGSDFKKEHSEFINVLKSQKTRLHDIEEQVLPVVQLIPNFVNPVTPPAEDVVLKQDPIDEGLLTLSHKEIGTRMGQLMFSETSPSAYFLLGQLSELEYAAQIYFAERLKSLGFTPLACPDFCKSFICEAVGSDPHSRDVSITLRPAKDDRESAQKHIVVGGSNYKTFCAYLTNMNVNESDLTLRYYSQGRSYDAYYRNSESPDLFSVVQSSSVHCLVLCKESNAEMEFDTLFENIVSCFTSFKIPQRIVEVSAKNLNSTESRRKCLELWSPSQKRFIRVSHVSQRGDFVSKRLRVTYGVEYTAMGYCSMVEGAAVNLPVLLGCILENYQIPNHKFDFRKTLKFLHEYIFD